MSTYPPASDPWGPHVEPKPDGPPPSVPPPYSGSAYDPPSYEAGRAHVAAPGPTAPLRRPTAPLPVVTPSGRRPGGPPRVSWQRAGSASRRKMWDGWGFSAFGLLVAFCGWGVWAASRPPASTPPLLSLGVVLAVAVVVFVVLRGVGYYVLEVLMHRPRPHARWSHLFTGVYLAAAGSSYFADTSWVSFGTDWISQFWDRWVG